MRDEIILNLLRVKVCVHHGITPNQLHCYRRDPQFIAARRDFAVIARSLDITFEAIGRAMNRDHASVINLIYPKKQGRKNVQAVH